jgi:hypothetical protein
VALEIRSIECSMEKMGGNLVGEAKTSPKDVRKCPYIKEGHERGCLF